MKLKLKGREPICHKECEHYKEPHWCTRIYPPERVDWQLEPPCIWGIRQQRDELLDACKDIGRTIEHLDDERWVPVADEEAIIDLHDAIKKAEGKR